MPGDLRMDIRLLINEDEHLDKEGIICHIS